VGKKRRDPHVGGQQLPLITPDTSWERPAELPDLRGRVAEIAEDTETRDDGLASGRGPGWAYRAGHLSGVSWAWREDGETRSIYVPVADPDTECHDRDAVRRWMRDHRAVVPCWVYQNAPYDLGWTQADLGLDPPTGEIHDVGLAAFMVDENRSDFRLDGMCRWRGLPGKDETLLREAVEVFGYPAADVKKHMWRLPARFKAVYAEQDAVSTLQLMASLLPEIEAESQQEAYRLERELIPMVLEMRRRGIRVGVEKAYALKDQLLAMREEKLAELRAKLGSSMIEVDHVRSPQHVERWMEAEGVPFERTERSGQGEFQRDWMRAHPHWLPRSVAAIRQLTEAAEKFVQSYVLDFLHKGRLHPSINQWRTEDGGTRSHRFSYSDPPLQQAPSRPDRVKDWELTLWIAQHFRDLFEPEHGEVWMKPDYSQQEFRLIVHFAERLRCRKATMAGDRYRGDLKTDFHTIAAELTQLPRRDAKDVNFAKAFGAGKGKFAQMTGTDEDTAAARMTQYDQMMPFVKELSERCRDAADRRGYVKLLDGARNHFSKWEAGWLSKEEWSRGMRENLPMGACDREEAERRRADPEHPWHLKRLRRADVHKAMSRVIQGSAARMTKRAMRECWREGVVPLLQMHDELDRSVGSERDARRTIEIMEHAARLTVPVVVDAGYGPSWGTAKKSWAEAAGQLKRTP
jgi:Mesyanzhinovviridae DNA polymerase